MSLKTSVLCFTALFSAMDFTWAGDRDSHFRRGRGGLHRGNERSERPARVPVGNPRGAGNGCPDGTMQVSFAPDNLSFSILFDQFIAESSGLRGARRDVMSCDALIPIEIPANMQMEITRVDYRGFVNLPAQSQARLHAIFNFRGRGGDGDRLNMKFDFQGPLTETYTISTDLIARGGTGTEVSPCGGSTVLRIFNQLQLVSRQQGQQAQATIDSIDGAANALYHVNWKRCTPQGEDGRGGGGGRGGRGGRGDRGFP
jgi:hypothetical protein